MEDKKSLLSGYSPVSVVIACYRCSATLARAVASVAVQTEVPAELILVDDCSGDSTRALILELVSTYTTGWIRTVMLKENVGAGSARNEGWAIATQPYVAFLDSDDAWHPEKIRIQMAYMLLHPDVVLCGHAHRILPTQDIPSWRLLDNDLETNAKVISKWGMLTSNRFVTPSVMLKRDIRHRFEDRQRYMEDHMLWLNIVCAGGLVHRLRAPLAAIYKRPYGQSGLSSQWWHMERGDLGNYRRLLRQGYITRIQYFGLALFSVAKFVRRYVNYIIFTPRPN